MSKQKPLNKPKTGYGKWLLLAIVACTILLYAGSLRNELLTFDDNDYFAYEEVRELSLDGVAKIFSGYYLIMYQPLPVLSFSIQHHFTGMDPYPFHLLNLLLHLCCVMAVYHFVRRLTDHFWIPLGVALLFAVHPMNVESVVWMSARSSTMYALFYLLALINYIDYIKGQRSKYLWFAGLFFVLSLFSKVQAVTLPMVMLLLDFYFGRKLLDKNSLLQKAPFFLMSVIFGLVALSDTDTQSNLTAGMLADYEFHHLPFMVTWSFMFYLSKLVLPIDLCGIYTYPQLENGWLPWIYYATSVPFAVAGWLLWKFRSNRYVVLGAGFFVLTIAINIQLIPSRLFIVADRYAYIPYLGLFLLLFILATQSNISKKTKELFPWVLAGFVVFFCMATTTRSKVWASDIPFLTDIIEKNEGAPYAYRAYGNRGFKYQSMQQFPKAYDDFTKAIELYATDGKTYYNRALVLNAMGRYRDAVRDLDSAAVYNPSQAIIFSTRGQLHALLSDTTNAIRDSEKAVAIDSLSFDAWNTLSTLAFSRSDFESCRRYLDKAIVANPKFAVGIKNRGILNQREGRLSEACADFQSASYLGNADAKSLYSQFCK
ncbi:MAG: hypothetical protein ACKOYC_10960 [Bacteroidota bacterium]